MAIERRQPGRHEEVTLVACPFCEAEIAERASFADHWKKCPDNPAGRGDE